MDGDGGKMSEYERDRLKRIEENRKKLKELFPEGTGLRQRGEEEEEGERADARGKREGGERWEFFVWVACGPRTEN